MLLLLGLLRGESGGGGVIRAQLGRHTISGGLSINRQRGGSIQGVGSKTGGGWRIGESGRLGNACLWAVAIVGESVTVVGV